MSVDKQRMPSVPPEQFDDRVHEILAMVGEPGSGYNFTHWFVNHPVLAKNWLVYNRGLFEGELPHTLREIIILRVAHYYGSDYEWVEHVEISKRIGLTQSHFDAVKIGSDAVIWSPVESACLNAVDQLCSQHDINDALWHELEKQLNAKQLMELLFVIGSYTLMAWVLRAVRMPLQQRPDKNE